MKRIAAIFLTLTLYPVISFAAKEVAETQVTAAHEAVGRVYVMSGSVSFGHGEKTGSEVNVSEPIVSGMTIKTGENSSALLKFEDGLVVTMQHGTIFQVREYVFDATKIENSKIDLAFHEGGVRLKTGQIGRNKRLAFTLLTPSATIRGGEAEFAVIKLDNLIFCRTLGGEIRITNSAGTASFKGNDSAVVPSSLTLASAFYATAPRGSFGELLSVPIIPPEIIEPKPVLVAAPPPEVAPVPVAVSVPMPEAAPAPAAATESLPAPVPEPAAPEPALAPEPSSVPEPAPVSEPTPETSPVAVPVPEPAPVAVPLPMPEASPVPAPAPVTVSEPAPASSSVLFPALAPTCTCNCTYSCK